MAVTLVIASGCSSPTDGVVVSTPRAETVPRGPLESLGLGSVSDRDRFDAEQRELQRCMAESGFVYEPLPYVEQVPARSPDPDYGFGYSIQLPMDPVTVEAPDPNAERLERLDPNARSAYLLALQGDQTVVAEMADDQGCYGRAFASTRPPRAARVLIGELQDEAQRRFFASPEWLEFEREQSGCWRAAGFEGDPATLAFQRYNALIGQYGDDVPPGELTEMQDYERDAAAASVSCDSKAQPGLIDAQFAIEQAIIDEHPELFELLDQTPGTAKP